MSKYIKCKTFVEKLIGKKNKESVNDNDFLRKDFGELIHRQKLSHNGIILLRLEEDTPSKRIKIVKNVIDRFGESLKGKFFVASEKGFRIR